MSDFLSLINLISEFEPTVIINCAGILNNSENIEDFANINVVLPRALAHFATNLSEAIPIKSKFKLIHISTNCVFKDLGPHSDNETPSASDLYTTYVLRGTVYERNKEDTKALQDYSQALEINPRALDTHFRKGLINRRLKNYEEAIEDFCRVIELDIDNGDAYYERGTTYAYLKDKDNVLKDFKSAAKHGNAEAREFLKSKNIKWD